MQICDLKGEGGKDTFSEKIKNLKKKKIYLLEVGFEPTHLSIGDLKSPALDHSAIPALQRPLLIFHGYRISLFRRLFKSLFLAFKTTNLITIPQLLITYKSKYNSRLKYFNHNGISLTRGD